MTDYSYIYDETLLQVKDVSVTLGGKPVLKGVDLEIKDIRRPSLTQGQVVGLLGPSGVGKTTLFRVIAGLRAPDTGTVLVGAEGRPVERGMVGVVAQDYPLFLHRSVLGNLTLAGRSAGMSRGEANTRATAILEQFGLGEHAHKYPVQLSGGQRQRIAIAQQLVCSDYLLLMDEPFSGLDPVAVQRVCNFLLQISASDETKTIILVTHDIAAALQVCDTIWLMGRDRDENGAFLPGACVKETVNLMDRGLAWRENMGDSPLFLETLREIRARFHTL